MGVQQKNFKSKTIFLSSEFEIQICIVSYFELIFFHALT